MNGIVLWDSMKLFGIRDGFSFWFRWSFINPIDIFIRKNIFGLKRCEQHGWLGCNLIDCEEKNK